MPHPSLPNLLLLSLLVLLLFGNCARNVYRLLGPGTTPTQVAQLKQLDADALLEFQAAPAPPVGASGPTLRQRQVLDSADAARRRLLTPEQYRRYRYTLRSGIRYPLHPPKSFR